MLRFLLAGACGLVIFAAQAGRAADIQLRFDCRARSGVVTLGDVAQVLAADPQEASHLAALELFPAPPPGRQRFVRLREIQDALLLRGVDLAQHRFGGTSQVRVLAAQEAIRVLDQRPVGAATAKKADSKASEPSTVAVVTAARALTRGAVVRPEDVQIQPVPTDDNLSSCFRSVEEVIGQETMRGVPEGKPLDRTCLRTPLAVRRGELVTVYARRSGIRVRTIGRARDEGSIGELITVESLGDRRTLTARVSGIQEAEVFVGAAAPEMPTAASSRIAAQPVYSEKRDTK